MTLPDFFEQHWKVYRYVIIKGFNSTLPAIAVLVTAYHGIVLGAAILFAQVIGGALTDLSFFSALDYKRPDNGSAEHSPLASGTHDE